MVYMMASMMEDQTNLVIHLAVMWASLIQKDSRMVAHLEFLTRKGSWTDVCLAGTMVVTSANQTQKASQRADY